MTSLDRPAWLKQVASLVRGSLNATMVPFRAALRSQLRTDKRRWSKVATEVPPWDQRNKLIGALIPAGSSVLDLGCGAMTLKGWLPPGCVYQPCDVVQSAPEVILCDFNEGLYPALDRQFDYVVCSGVLEYMRAPLEFLQRISGYGSKVILSYNPVRAGEGKMARLAGGWLNHMSQPELESLFRDAGLGFKLVLTRDAIEVTYELAKIS
jgi:hypothetical protein